MFHNIILKTKPFNYTINMSHTEVRIEFVFKRHTLMSTEVS